MVHFDFYLFQAQEQEQVLVAVICIPYHTAAGRAGQPFPLDHVVIPSYSLPYLTLPIVSTQLRIRYHKS